MAKKRFIQWQGQTWSLTELARAHNLNPATLKSRLDVAKLPLVRALATGICTKSQAGQRGAAKSVWRYTATGDA